MSLIPGLGIVARHGPHPAPLLPAQGDQPVPGDPGRDLAQVPGPAAAPVRRARHAQVRDLLPVRPGLPDRVHRHGRGRHEGPLCRSLGRFRDLRRAARGVRPAPGRPDRARRGLPALGADRHRAGRCDPPRRRPRPQADARDPRGDPVRLRLPARRCAQADQLRDGRLVRHGLRHRHLLRPPPVRAAGPGLGAASEPAAVGTGRAQSTAGYLAGLDLVAGGHAAPPKRAGRAN